MAREPDELDTLPGTVDDLTRGVDSVLGREVAMVSLPPATGDALTVRTDQVRRLAALHHPSLLEVYDVDGLAEDTASTLVLQSVDGHSLATVVATAPWPAVSVAHVGSQVADGLAHAHAHGVVHGGIGPASIVVDESLHAWLTGFTAALRSAGTTTPTGAGDGAADGPRSPAEDVAALSTTLRALLDTGTPVPTVLEVTLRAMRAGHLDARESAVALTDAAETCADGGVAGGVVPMAVHSARISTGRTSGGGTAGPVSAPHSRGSAPSGAASPSAPSPVPAAAAAAAAAAIVAAREPGPAAPHAAGPAPTPVPSPAPTPARSPAPSPAPPPAPATVPAAGPAVAASSALVPSPRPRVSRRSGRGLRVAVLGGATAALVVASGAVIWVTNSFSSPLTPSSTGTVQDGAGDALDRSGPVPAAPAGSDAGRDPLTDVTTLAPADDGPTRTTDPGRSDGTAAAPPADGAPPAASDTGPPASLPERPASRPTGAEPPRSGSTTTPPGTTPRSTNPPSTNPPSTTPPGSTRPTTSEPAPSSSSSPESPASPPSSGGAGTRSVAGGPDVAGSTGGAPPSRATGP